MPLKALWRSLRAEAAKLRGAGLWAVLLLMPLLATAYGTFSFAQYADRLGRDWGGLWSQHTMYYALFFFAPMLAVCAAYLWRLEHLGHNWALVLSMPLPPLCLYLAKLGAALAMTLLAQGWTWLLYLLGGKFFVGLPGLPPPETLWWALRGALAAVPVLALQLLLSMLWRSFAPPVLLALLGGIAGFLFVSNGWGLYWPYALPVLGMSANRSADLLTGQALPFAAACLGFTALFCAAAGAWLRKKDIA